MIAASSAAGSARQEGSSSPPQTLSSALGRTYIPTDVELASPVPRCGLPGSLSGDETICSFPGLFKGKNGSLQLRPREPFLRMVLAVPIQGLDSVGIGFQGKGGRLWPGSATQRPDASLGGFQGPP